MELKEAVCKFNKLQSLVNYIGYDLEEGESLYSQKSYENCLEVLKLLNQIISSQEENDPNLDLSTTKLTDIDIDTSGDVGEYIDKTISSLQNTANEESVKPTWALAERIVDDLFGEDKSTTYAVNFKSELLEAIESIQTRKGFAHFYVSRGKDNLLGSIGFSGDNTLIVEVDGYEYEIADSDTIIVRPICVDNFEECKCKGSCVNQKKSKLDDIESAMHEASCRILGDCSLSDYVTMSEVMDKVLDTIPANRKLSDQELSLVRSYFNNLPFQNEDIYSLSDHAIELAWNRHKNNRQ